MTKCIAIIPARSKSKRIKNKNIKLFNGIPAIGVSINKIKSTKLFERVIVSTDSEEIAKISRDYGAEVPFLRPDNLSDEFTPTAPVIRHALEELQKLGFEYSYACCVYPCNPLIQELDIIQAYKQLLSSKANFIYSITKYAHPIQRALKYSYNKKLQFINSKYELTRTQDLETLYHDAGQFYWGRTIAWLKERKMHSDGVGYLIPHWRAVDIDTDDDWKRAEMLIKVLAKEEIE